MLENRENNEVQRYFNRCDCFVYVRVRYRLSVSHVWLMRMEARLWCHSCLITAYRSIYFMHSDIESNSEVARQLSMARPHIIDFISSFVTPDEHGVLDSWVLTHIT